MADTEYTRWIETAMSLAEDYARAKTLALQMAMPPAPEDSLLHFARTKVEDTRKALRSHLTTLPTTSLKKHTNHPMRHWDRTCPACNPAASLGEQREPKRPDSLPVILNMLRETKGGDECRVPTPACWDLARYITDLERLAASPASDGAGGGVCIDCNTPLQRFCSECKAGPLGTSPDQQKGGA
jgi:hypothetical protein